MKNLQNKITYRIERFDCKYQNLTNSFLVDENDTEEYFNSYLKYNASLDQEEGIAATYIYIELIGDIPNKILGFCSLRSSSLITNIENEKIGEPAIEIYELAVHKDYQKSKIGTQLMKYVMYIANKLKTEYIGVKHLVVCSKKSAVGFYEKFNFKPLDQFSEVPRAGDNKTCVPMSLRIAFKD